MRIRRVTTFVMTLLLLTPTMSLTGRAQQASPKSQVAISATRNRRHKARASQSVIPPMTILHNPEYLSGEASVSVAANSNPLIRIGIAQNGVTLIEFPAADRFFAVHAGNSDLVTVEKSPSLKRDHHLVLRAGTGFLVPNARSKGPIAAMPATSIIAQMDSGMTITVMIYPVPLLKQQAHRLVIKYDRDEVISARRSAGLATNLVGPEIDSQSSSEESLSTSTSPVSSDQTQGNAVPQKSSEADYKEPLESALKEAVENPRVFKKWGEQRHGLKVSTLLPRDLSDSVRLVVFAVRNVGTEALRLIAGYPDLYVETLNEKRKPVEAGTKIEKLCLASSVSDNLLAAGETRYFAIAYQAPILGAQQHIKIVVAHMSAADEPAMVDLSALAH